MTSKINFNKIAYALIGRFDNEVSTDDYGKLFKLMNNKEREIFFVIELKMHDKSVIITTKESRENQETKKTDKWIVCVIKMLYKIIVYVWVFRNKKWKKIKDSVKDIECENINDAKKYLQSKILPSVKEYTDEYEYSIQLIK